VAEGNSLGDRPTIPELLSESGYTTTAFYRNSWLEVGGFLGGFDKSHTPVGEQSTKKNLLDLVNNHSPKMAGSIQNIHREVSRITESVRHLFEWNQGRGSDTNHRADKDVVDAAISSFDNIDSPFFTFIHLNDVHWRYNPPTPYHSLYSGRSTFDLIKNYQYWQWKVYGTRENRLKTTVGDISPPKEEVKTFKNMYRSCATYADNLLKTIVEKLKSTGDWKNTVLIVFGDHGDSFGENNVFGHHLTVSESVINVPLYVIDNTGEISTGIEKSPASLVDLYPTVLSLAEVNYPNTPGIDLKESTREYAYVYYDVSEHAYYSNAPSWGISHRDLPPAKQFAIWKSASPDENAVWYPDQPDDVDSESELQSILQEHWSNLRPIEASSSKMSGRVEEQLEDMGYLR
jgi:arylsulfatase A-like enzyme